MHPRAPKAPHITSLYIYLCFLFILIALSIEMTRTKKSTTTTSPLKGQDASKKASKSDSGAEAAEVEGTESEEYVTLATLKQMLSTQESTLKSIFESFIMSVNLRVDDLVKSVAEVKYKSRIHAERCRRSRTNSGQTERCRERDRYFANRSSHTGLEIRVPGEPEPEKQHQGIRDPGIARRNLGSR